MKEKIERIIIQAIKELNEEFNKPALKNPNAQTILYGKDGALDSLALVALIRDVEEAVSEAFSTDIILVDDRAMSQKVSPFRSVGALTSYIETLLT
jgi:acyl carrier protein